MNKMIIGAIVLGGVVTDILSLVEQMLLFYTIHLTMQKSKRVICC